MARKLEDLQAKEKPEAVAAAEAKTSNTLFEIRLSEIRLLAEKTQSEIADTMDVKQPTVAGLEKVGQDMRLSSLKRYVEALGGRVRVDIELPDGSHHGFPV